jgi:hypothetical protein
MVADPSMQAMILTCPAQPQGAPGYTQLVRRVLCQSHDFRISFGTFDLLAVPPHQFVELAVHSIFAVFLDLINSTFLPLK